MNRVISRTDSHLRDQGLAAVHQLATLPQKAGCQPEDLRRVVLKELVDNALDAGAAVSLDHADGAWIVTDDGPGIDPAEVPRLFAVGRPLRSSKLVRLPLRGMLGNGLRVVAGAVAATEGSLVVETRGRRLALAVCRETGRTTVTSGGPVPPRPGVTVRLSLGPGSPADGSLARASIAVARCGQGYAGPSSPWWYGAKDLHRLFARVTPADTTVGALCRSLGLALDDDRPARTLGRDEAEAVLARLRAGAEPMLARAPGLHRARRAGRIGPATRARPAPRPRSPAPASPMSWRPGPSARAQRRRGRGRCGSACS